MGILRSVTESAPPESANGDNKASSAPEMAGTTGDVPVQAGGQQPDHPRSPAVPPSRSKVHSSETTVYPATPAVYPRGAAGHRPEPAAYPPPTAARPGPGVYGPETTARLPAPSLYPPGTPVHPSVQTPSPGAYPERPDPRGAYSRPDHSVSPSRAPAPEGDVPSLMRYVSWTLGEPRCCPGRVTPYGCAGGRWSLERPPPEENETRRRRRLLWSGE